jgi:hypothetical protein
MVFSRDANRDEHGNCTRCARLRNEVTRLRDLKNLMIEEAAHARRRIDLDIAAAAHKREWHDKRMGASREFQDRSVVPGVSVERIGTEKG